MRAFQLVAWQSPPELRDAEGRLCVELLSSNLPRRVSGIGASRPLRPLPAMVSFLSRKPALSLDGRNRSSCPKTALAGHVLAAAPAAVQEAIHSGNKPHHLKPSFL